MAKAISVEGLSKAYQLGDFGTGTISRDVERFIARIRGKEDPFLRIGETNDRSTKGESDIVWCLKNLNFDIEQGDAVGIIGRNGAGKSTLLKILSRITSPTTGSIKIKGRIASLLEVGTGFHPELSGRENIYLNGAILGMRKSEIKRKFDEIVDFAGVERYIDTPVKRYSSGMYVRLAFAVAAHLESEILIVDEVLAVGDAEFQKKCLGKMGDISKGEGRTVLFVSHNIGAVEKLCSRGILLDNGKNIINDKIHKVIDKYLALSVKSSSVDFELKAKSPAEIYKVGIFDINENPVSEVQIMSKWQIKIEFIVHEEIDNFITAIGLSDSFGYSLKTTWQPKMHFKPGRYLATFVEDRTNFALGRYFIHASIAKGLENIQFHENAISFDIVEGNNAVEDTLLKIESHTGIIIDQMKYNVIELHA
jgi:lipopolysaccharide transport system ATP-binding protein